MVKHACMQNATVVFYLTDKGHLQIEIINDDYYSDNDGEGLMEHGAFWQYVYHIKISQH